MICANDVRLYKFYLALLSDDKHIEFVGFALGAFLPPSFMCAAGPTGINAELVFHCSEPLAARHSERPGGKTTRVHQLRYTHVRTCLEHEMEISRETRSPVVGQLGMFRPIHPAHSCSSADHHLRSITVLVDNPVTIAVGMRHEIPAKQL